MGKIINEECFNNFIFKDDTDALTPITSLSFAGEVRIYNEQTNNNNDYYYHYWDDDREDILDSMLILGSRLPGKEHDYKYVTSELTDLGFEYLAHCLHFNNSVNSLTLSENSITKEGFQYLKLFIHKLKAFHIKRIKLDYQSLNIIGLNFKNCVNLKELTMNKVALYSETIEILSKHLLNLQGLEKLNLESNNIDDDLVKILTRTFKKMESLHTLNLRKNMLIDLYHSFQSYIEDCELSILLLYGNPLSGSANAFIMKGLKKNSSLNYIETRHKGNSISELRPKIK